MAKNINHIQHVKSSVVISGAPKLPAPEVLVEGELAINYAEGLETISIKNSVGDIVTFSSDSYFNEKYIGDFSGKTVEEIIDESESATTAAILDLNDRVTVIEEDFDSLEGEIMQKMDDRLGSAFTGSNSGNTVTEYLNGKLDASAYTPTDLSDYYTKGEVDGKISPISGDVDTLKNSVNTVSGDVETLKSSVNTISGNVDTLSGTVNTVNSKVTELSGVVIDNEYVIASSLNDLNLRKLDASAYTPTDLTEVYNKIDMLSGVVEENELVTAAALNSLNSNKLDISAYTPTDLSNYYTKSEVDDVIDVINDDMNGLSARVDEISGATIGDLGAEIAFISGAVDTVSGMVDSVSNNVNTVSGDVSTLSGTVNTLTGNISTLSGTVNTLTDNISTISGDVNSISDKVSTISGDVNTLKGTVNSVSGDLYTFSANVANNYYTTAQTNAAISAATSNFFDDAEYDSNTKRINFKHNGTVKDYIDATDFIKDGMVSSAYTSAVTIGSATTNYLIIEFNEDAGKDIVKIDIADIFNPELYYTKEEVDDDMYVVASSLNDLNDRKLDASAYTPTDLTDVNNKINIISGDVNTISSKINTVSGDVATVSENLGILSGQVSDLSGEVASALSDFVTTQDFEDKLGSGFTGENSGRTITQTIVENELVVAGALTDLNERKLDASAYTPTDLSNYYTKSQVDTKINAVSGDVNTLSGTVNGLTGTVNTLTGNVNTISGDVQSISSSLATLSAKDYFDDAQYDSDEKKIIFYHGTESAATIDATAFIKDGMVNNVEISGSNLVVTFNTDAGKEPISIPISNIFDANNYYNKTTIDGFISGLSGDIASLSASTSGFVTTVEFENKLGSGFTEGNSGITVTQALDEYELVVATALTDLNERKLDASAFTLSDYYTKEEIDNAELATSAALNDLNTRIEMMQESMVLDDTLTYSGSSASTNAVQAQAIIAYLEDKELAIAAALTDLDSRLHGVAYMSDVQAAIADNAPLAVFDDTVSASTKPVQAQALYNVIADNEYVTSTALNTLNTRLTVIENMMASINSVLNSLDTRITAIENATA